jgi:hypothetical protein
MERKLTSIEKELQQYQDEQRSMAANTSATLQELSSDLQNQFATKLTEIRTTLTQELRDTYSKIRDLERLCSTLNIKLEDQAEKWGEPHDMKISRLESKLRQLQLKQRSLGWEEDVEFRIERNENNFESRLLNSNKQQARLGAWQEKQIADLSDHVDQRLWSLYSQLEIQRNEIITLSRQLIKYQSSLNEPCSEAERLNKILVKLSATQNERDNEKNTKIAALEVKVTSIEQENCRLSRLADRLCSVLQMWEQRHKSASMAEAATLQSLQERYNMAIVEMSLSRR